MKSETNTVFSGPIRAVNIGARLLGEALKQQDADTVMLDWRPPKEVHLSPRIREILGKLNDPEPFGEERRNG